MNIYKIWKEWDQAVKRLRESGYDLSKIKIGVTAGGELRKKSYENLRQQSRTEADQDPAEETSGR